MIYLSKNTIKINSGKLKMTKYDPMTGALSTKPEDIRLCTETVQEIQKKKSVDTYELPDGNSDYPMGIYEKGVKYDVSVIMSDMSDETKAFLNNTTLAKGSGTMKDIIETAVPSVAPYEIALLGKVSGTPIVVDANNEKWSLEETTLATKKFKLTPGVDPAPDKLTFDASDAGKPIHIEYNFEADSIESYSEKRTSLLPVILLEIVHETMSSDKTKKFKNNTILKKMQYTGSFDETLKREHSPETLAFVAVRPNGIDVAENKKFEIPIA